MADIFLSYAREDLVKAKALAVALESRGWTVFWDRSSILAGQDFDEVIEQAIEAAKCMLVLWSNASKKSHYVRDEARIGRDRNLLIPILVESISPPMGFGSLHSESFADWNGDLDSEEFNKLLRSVTRLVSPKVHPEQAAPAQQQNTMPKPIIKEPEMVKIPAGSFLMGSDRYDDEKPIHTVNIVKPFYIGKYPVTFDEYDHYAQMAGIKKPEDEGWGRGQRPVINVSWHDAIAYATWLSERTRKSYRLPSEAEWEYAARANTTSDYFWGNSEKDAKDFAWYNVNAGGKTKAVGQKKPNAFGLYDMSGNVWEWVQDCWHGDYTHAPTDGNAWLEQNNGDCAKRSVRGGSWSDIPECLRSAYRYWVAADVADDDQGFRLARDI